MSFLPDPVAFVATHLIQSVVTVLALIMIGISAMFSRQFRRDIGSVVEMDGDLTALRNRIYELERLEIGPRLESLERIRREREVGRMRVPPVACTTRSAIPDQPVL